MVQVEITADATALLEAIENARKKAIELKQALARIQETPIRIIQK